MDKLFACFVLFIITTNACFSVGLELSDIIKEARETEKNKISQVSNKYGSIKPVKNERIIDAKEQSACEKINTNEILGKGCK